MNRSAPTIEQLTSLYVLDSIKGFGPQKMKQLFLAGISPTELLREPERMPVPGKRGEDLRKLIQTEGNAHMDACHRRAEKQLELARETSSFIVTYDHPLYPKRLFESNSPVGILYVRGKADVITSPRTVACVGSRGIRPPYVRLHADLAREAAKLGFAVVSGFALGADTVGHKAAVSAGGATICVMPSGLDRPFPPENKSLWHDFLAGTQTAFVSEFPFGTGANSLNLRKRNKLIVAFAQGVLISQSSATGGAMNAFRFAVEQKRAIATFQMDGSSDTSGNELIAACGKPRARVFPIVELGEGEYREWLQAL